MAQLLIQVAGRAGRADKVGRVLLQTRHPEHPLLLTLIRQGYGAFAAAALRERQQAGLPPFAAQALLRAEAVQPEPPEEFLRRAVEAAAPWRSPDLALWGPVPAPMERRAGRYRAHLLAQAAGRPALQTFLERWVPELHRLPGARGVRWSLDVDPQELL
jgi:primosomal protein N' (replication factor Y)